MFNTSELHTLHGREANLEIGPLRVRVRIHDSRQVFARVDCLVSPLAGSGRQWVSVDRLSEPTTQLATG